MKKIIKAILFLILGVLILQVLEDILSLKMNSLESVEDFNRTFNQFYSLEEDSLQAVFLGKSTVKWAVSPIQIYEESNIVTYNLASNVQPIEASYYLLNEVFERQSPSVVFCDISALFQNLDEDSAWHIVMDNTPLNGNKIRAAMSYAREKTNGESLQILNKYFLSVMSPLYFYHNRWEGLTQNDFLKPDNPNFDYSVGYYMASAVNGTTLTYENINSEIDVIDIKGGFKQEYLNGVYTESVMDGELYHVNLEQKAVEYITKMKELCEEHNAKLVMIKIPTLAMPQLYYASWSYDKYVLADRVCNELGVPFLDMVYDEEYKAEIDWGKDTIDGGLHLNVRGAEQVTENIAAYCENLGLTKITNKLYEQYACDYNRVKQICMLQSEFILDEYITSILKNENFVIVISAQDDFQASLSEDVLESLKRLGLQSYFTDGVRDSFIGIVDHGEVIYEALSNRRIDYVFDSQNGVKIQIVSSGFNAEAYSSVKINGREYSTNMCGLNFVIFDKSTNLVVDSVNFNTSLPGADAYRNENAILELLSQYKRKIINEGDKK